MSSGISPNTPNDRTQDDLPLLLLQQHVC